MIEIRHLKINRFRGISDLNWRPQQGVNLIIGGGDCGKTTILEAIGLLFQSSNSFSLTEADYYNRKTEDGFEIEAVIAVSQDLNFSSERKMYWPWEWNGQEAVLPRADAEEISEPQHPVYRVAITASSDFDLSWEMIQPNGNRDSFPIALRKRIGLVNLSGNDKNDRDLRLVYGSALDRLISTDNLRSKISQIISQVPLDETLSDASKESLAKLDQALSKASLPSDISLNIAGSQGISIGALVSLFAKQDEVALPFSSWGAGTRRMASLEVAAAHKTEAQINLIDEIERGLEPYRLRQLMRNLLAEEFQSFVTTHSPVAVESAPEASLWYLGTSQSVGYLAKEKIQAQQVRDPETFLSKLPIIVEGQTEQGFVSAILERLFESDPQDFGMRVCVGQGDDQLLELLEALDAGDVTCCGFVDRDGGKASRWATLKASMQDRLFQWEQGCLEINLIPLIPADQLERLFQQGESWNGYRLRSIADRLNIENKDFADLLAACGDDREVLRSHIIKASTGDYSDLDENEDDFKSNKKQWKAHGALWFKIGDGSGGRELLGHIEEVGAWDQIELTLRPFFNAILQLLKMNEVNQVKL